MGLFSRSPAAPKPIKLPNGEWLHCKVCSQDHFHLRKGLISNPLQSWLDMEWMGRAAHCFVCAECGYVHWFHWRNASLRKIQE